METRKNILPLLFILFFASCQQPDSEHQGAELNRLAEASSPYLQQHADNPVNWYEWGEEALSKAKAEDKPLIISIGYAACHWCHVMEHESFEDTAVARIMNENFIAIKIDREERPDIDQVYMNAAELLNGRGGWPLNAFALPDGKPFYAGTYFPKERWTTLLEQVSKLYKNQKGQVVQQAEDLTQGIQNYGLLSLQDSLAELTPQKYNELFTAWEPNIDFEKGGYGPAPKFPLPAAWEFLLQYHYLTGNEKALTAVTTTLDAMQRGGIYDHLGGGFARYSTETDWLVPHFEKMLYDNAQLLSLYAHAYQLTQKEAYAEVIQQTLNFIERELSNGEGAYYSSINSDSEGEEGKYYTWTSEQWESVLEDESAKLLKKYYNLNEEGNWEKQQNILHTTSDIESFAKDQHLSIKEFNNILSEGQQKLFEAREERIRPSTDDKVLCSWNALMLKALVDVYHALGDENYLEQALDLAYFLEKNMMGNDGKLWRNYKDGKASIHAFLDDYALLADAFLVLYQATFDKHWLDQARLLTEYAISNFKDEKGPMFYYASAQSQDLIARKMEVSDHVIPASNSVMAHVLYRLGLLYDHAPFLEQSKQMLEQVQPEITEGGAYYANWARLLGLQVYEPYEIAVVGEEFREKSRSLQQKYLPTALFMGGIVENLPLLKNKLVDGQTTIYVCQNKVCKLPVTDTEKALTQLQISE
ncbi:thioredoxin domain-containing protein [Catalinimonas alkaloidigena]|uniref:thioredoxin domain-containing protein n=1 Tax=Catalinimonas alkaloidigena TaxID=1075417 RepID=UPI0024067F74|nr:thioredoxin domain-containing protein [Catalinimonas alkaloidigena]